MLAPDMRVEHPTLIDAEAIERIRRNIASSRVAAEWYASERRIADHVLAQDAGYVERMVPELTPWALYSFACPACYGTKSQEGDSESGIIGWDWRDPEAIRCRRCGQVYPSADYPETGVLVCPRSDQTLTYFLNPEERAHPGDRSGRYSWKLGRVSDPPELFRHHSRVQSRILDECRAIARPRRGGRSRSPCRGTRRRVPSTPRGLFGGWLYHDYWESYADCDPLWAAWNDTRLPLAWETASRHRGLRARYPRNARRCSRITGEAGGITRAPAP